MLDGTYTAPNAATESVCGLWFDTGRDAHDHEATCGECEGAVAMPDLAVLTPAAPGADLLALAEAIDAADVDGILAATPDPEDVDLARAVTFATMADLTARPITYWLP